MESVFFVHFIRSMHTYVSIT